MNEFNNKLYQACHHDHHHGKPESFQFSEKVRNLVDKKLDEDIETIHNDCFKKENGSWIKKEIRKRNPEATGVADDASRLDSAAIGVTFEVVLEFERKLHPNGAGVS